LESQSHLCRGVHLADSWALSKTVQLGRLQQFQHLEL
jgi:hypothetical protein